MEKFYTVTTIAQELEISKRTVHRLLADGQIGHYRFGNRIKFSETHLADFLKKSEYPAL